MWRIEFVRYGLSGVLMRGFELQRLKVRKQSFDMKWIHTRKRMCRVLLLTEPSPISSKWKKNNFKGREDNRK